MGDAWQILRDAGLPLDGPRAPVFEHGLAELAAATRAAVGESPSGRPAEALAAFVLAWQQHWPATFASAFGVDADTLVDWASRQFTDPGRYLKLRRIALAQLAHVV